MLCMPHIQQHHISVCVLNWLSLMEGVRSVNCISCTLWTDKSSSQGISLSTRIDSSCTGDAHSLLVQLLLCSVILSHHYGAPLG